MFQDSTESMITLQTHSPPTPTSTISTSLTPATSKASSNSAGFDARKKKCKVKAKTHDHLDYVREKNALHISAIIGRCGSVIIVWQHLELEQIIKALAKSRGENSVTTSPS